MRTGAVRGGDGEKASKKHEGEREGRRTCERTAFRGTAGRGGGGKPTLQGERAKSTGQPERGNSEIGRNIEGCTVRAIGFEVARRHE